LGQLKLPPVHLIVDAGGVGSQPGHVTLQQKAFLTVELLQVEIKGGYREFIVEGLVAVVVANELFAQQVAQDLGPIGFEPGIPGCSRPGGGKKT
jgi:hypothetical protein